jgi:hypothetical protein
MVLLLLLLCVLRLHPAQQLQGRGQRLSQCLEAVCKQARTTAAAAIAVAAQREYACSKHCTPPSPAPSQRNLLAQSGPLLFLPIWHKLDTTQNP